MNYFDNRLINKGKKKFVIASVLLSIFLISTGIYEIFFTQEGISLRYTIGIVVSIYALYDLYRGDTLCYTLIILLLGVLVVSGIGSILYIITDSSGVSEFLWVNIILWFSAVITTTLIFYRNKSIREIYAFIKYKESIKKRRRL